MTNIVRLFLIVFTFSLMNNVGLSQDLSWEKAKQNGSGELVIAYSENSPFIYKNSKGKLEGIEYELINEFVAYVKEKHNVSLTPKWEHLKDFQTLVDTLTSSNRSLLGIASLSVTQSRKSVMKFCEPYMPDIEIIVSSSDLGTASNLNEFSKIVREHKAMTVANSTFEKNIFEIKENYFPDIEVSYVPHVDQLISNVVQSNGHWGYISLPNYLSYYKNGGELNRQRFFMVENIGLAVATTISSDWSIALNEFFSDPKFKTLIASLIEKYLGNTFNHVVATISNNNSILESTISTTKEVGVLTLERELQDLKIRETELELHNKNLIIYLALAGLILISVALATVFRTMRLKTKTNNILSEKNEQIKSQALHLQQSYENLKMLSSVGQEISASLSVEKINVIVYNKLIGLMDADGFGIGIFNPTENTLEFSGVVEKGEKLKYHSFDLNDESRLAVKCFTNKEEIVIRNLEEEYKDFVKILVDPKEGRNPASLIYMPLMLGSKPIGVLTVQSFKIDAFNEYQVDIVRNVANYAKIAIDNASAYSQIYNQTEFLKTANQQISEKNKYIEQQNHELIDLNKEKNDLIGIVAHDLKNPLTSAMSVTDLFKNDPLTEDQKEYLYLISKCLNRMNGLVSKILDIKLIETKKLNLHIAKTDIKKSVEQVINELEIQSKNKSIAIIKNLDSCTMDIDKAVFVQIIDNLLSNALKFSNPDSKVEINLKDLNDTLRIEVIDEGPGISKEDQMNLFKKFQKLSAKPTAGENSTGLGLSIVKKYVEELQGKVWCESENGKGAKFIVEFNKLV